MGALKSDELIVMRASICSVNSMIMSAVGFDNKLTFLSTSFFTIWPTGVLNRQTEHHSPVVRTAVKNQMTALLVESISVRRQ